MGLRDQLILQYSQQGLNNLLKEMQEIYQKKKGDRFNVEGITYEIGTAKTITGAVEFEISSKIPQEELSGKYDLNYYFKSVREGLKGKEHPQAIDMENIIRSSDKDQEKKRDYVKLNYRYKHNTLYNDQKIIKEAEELRENPSKHELINIPGVVTLAGKLFLLSIMKSTYKKAKKSVENLITINKQVRDKIKHHSKTT